MILNFSGRAYCSGMQAGKIHGQKQAFIDGGLAGWDKGLQLGMEVS